MKHIIITAISLVVLLAACREKKEAAATAHMADTVQKAGAPAAGDLLLSDQQVQLGNIRTENIGKDIIGDKTVLTATLNVDETGSVAVNARIAGRIEKLYFKSTGDYLHKGDHLYDIYSEVLNNAKQEYLLALEKQSVLDNSIIDFKRLVESARNKLLLWGMSEAQVAELAKTKKTSPLTSFYSPAAGFITTLESHEGDYIAEGTTIMRLSGLSSLWAEAQVYASQLSAIDRQGSAVVQLPDLGNREISGRLEFVNPEINPATRINLIRVAIPNAGGLLKPGMPAYVLLKNRQRHSLTLPADAVIRGEKHNVVWLQTGHNTYKGVAVQTGLEDGDRIEILSGITDGDTVVTSGAWLLNSEYIFRYGAGPVHQHPR